MNGQNEPNTFLVRFEQSVNGLESRIRILEDRLARSETSFTNKEEKCREHARQLAELYDARNATNLKLVPLEQMLKEDWKTGNILSRLQGAETRLTAVEKKADEAVKSTEGVGKLQDNVEGIKSEKKEAKDKVLSIRLMIYTGIFGIICSILTALATYYIIGK